ncbi:MAG: hypothetical protein MZV70_64405 [Desulfobacterales bacterium]|nr:hypothetical protein [Desulfobacterales bacterium]
MKTMAGRILRADGGAGDRHPALARVRARLPRDPVRVRNALPRGAEKIPLRDGLRPAHRVHPAGPHPTRPQRVSRSWSPTTTRATTAARRR